MGNCCQNTIKQFDLFGILVTFHINSEYRYKSIYGGICTIILILFITGYTIFLGYPFVTRKNINFIYSNKIIENQPYINLTRAHFKLGFGIQYQDTALPAIKDCKKYFDYSIILKEWIGKDDIIEIPFNLKQCDYSDFFNIVNESFDRNHINEMICPVLNKSVNFTLEGLFTDSYTKFLQLKINISDYGLNNIDEVRNFMDKNPIDMVIYFLDSGIDYKNRTTPLPLYINYITRGLDLYFEKTTEIFLSTIEFTNDENLFINNGNVTIDGMFDKSEDSFRYIISRNNLNDRTIGRFILKASSKVVLLYRKYQKLPTFLAELSGIAEEAFLIIFLIVNFIERQSIENKLIRKMFKMKGNKYHEINYFLNLFGNDKSSNKIINLVQKQNLEIEKNNFNSKESNLKLHSHKSSTIILDNYINKLTDNQTDERDKIDLLNINNKIDSKRINDKINNKSIESQLSDENFEYNKRNDYNNNLKKKIKFITNVYPNKKKENKEILKAEKDFPLIGVLSTYYTYICFCTNKYQKRKYELIIQSKSKLNYYLEICNYIKGMQEIDLLKYCLFEKEQMIIFDYLAKPPFKIKNKTDDIYIYDEFEKNQITFDKIDKKEINKVYDCYNKIKRKENVTFEDLKLLRLLNAEYYYLN